MKSNDANAAVKEQPSLSFIVRELPLWYNCHSFLTNPVKRTTELSYKWQMARVLAARTTIAVDSNWSIL